MSDKQSLAEAVKAIRKRGRIVKKSLAGIGREFKVDKEPQALTTVEPGLSIAFPVAREVVEKSTRRKLNLKKQVEEPKSVEKEELVEEPKPVEKEEVIEKEEAVPKKRKLRKAIMPPEEEKQTKYRVKRNTVPFFL